MPYREEKPLTELIPPDRRRAKTLGLVALGMVAGAGMLYALQQAAKDAPTIVSSATTPQSNFSTTLDGPDGTLTFPARGRKTIVHVWLQACADCMPAFEAIQHASESEPGTRYVGADIVNVAYGTADPEWAAKYGVRQHLVFDRGGAKVVKPFGISSFTTLVFDESGKLIGRDRPDRPGYFARIAALTAPLDPTPISAKDIENVISAQRRSVRDVCWRTRDDLSSGDVTISVVIGGDGAVVSAISRGRDERLAKCIEDEVKRWRFRATGETSVPVDIPFKFVRQE